MEFYYYRYFPREILFEILTRLPAKSIHRFNCVSKLFRSIIADPHFAEVHHRRSSARPGGVNILLALPSPPCKHEFYAINYTDPSIQEKIRFLEGPDFENLTNPPAAANGLVCLSNNDGDVAVCNPSTRRHVFLPTRRFVRRRPSQSYALVVLGFDRGSGKYKVFMSEMKMWGGLIMRRHSVFTLGVDKSWREVCVHPKCMVDSLFIISFPDESVHVDGVIYLISWMKKQEIIAFRVGDEDMRLMPFPDIDHRTLHFQSYMMMILASRWIELDGRLALINVHHEAGERSNMDVWTLEKSRMRWEKISVSIPLEESMMIKKSLSIAFATTGFGEIVVSIQEGHSLWVLLYAYRRQVWRKIEVCKLVGCVSFYVNDRLKTSVDVIHENLYFFEN
ncbi:unnamed protein product [Cuscuta campestris]|uniref:F-box domain-containing protein n=1 Tax=Cuscuta campestris TaxID=132261 RepID=A0A484N2N3_9ASTE|nr:unnamed protein product [Cuscuta campestris]